MPESIESFENKSTLELLPHMLGAADSQDPKSIEEKGLFGIMESIVTGDTER